METKNKRWILAVVLVLSAISVLADIKTTTLTFVIPSSVSHTVYYGGSCDSSNVFFIDEDGTYDGTMNKINASSDSTANQNWCQNLTAGVLKLDNTGNEEVNFTAKWDSALSGVTLKAGINWSSYEAGACSDAVGFQTCVTISDGYTWIANNSAAGTNTSIWLWADMSNFNSGESTAGITRTFSTNATAS